MSLVVWLPLTKDLRNQGLANVTVTNYGATLDNNGKLGKCYYFDGTDDRITVSGLSLPNVWSYSCWIYSATSSRSWEAVIMLNSTGGDSDLQLGFYTYPGGNRIQNTANGQWNSSIAWTYGVWHHFCGTFDGSNLKTYIDGILIDTKAITASLLSRTNLTIGARSTNAANTTAGTFFQGKLNDVRIYDHCLSPMEVKELAKGLVLHYPLNDKSIESTTNLNTKVNMNNSTNSIWGGHSTTTTTYDCTNEPVPFNSGNKIEITYPVGDNTGGGTSINLGVNIPVTSSTIYTLSVYLKASDNFSYWTANFIYYYGDSSGHGIFNINNKEYIGNGWYRIWGTLTTGSSQTSLNPYFYSYPGGNRTYYIGGWQLEQKDHMTPFTPPGTSRDNYIIYDCSGFCNNGTRTGTFTWTSDTPKYAVSQVFNGTDNAIQTPNLTTMITDKNYTIACWTYKTVIGTKNYQTIYGGPSGFELEARSGSSTSPLYRIHNWGGGTTAYNFGEWTHFCFVHTDLDSKLYVNGELKITGTSVNIPSGNYFVGAWNTSTSQNYEGNMSDFRIYATALSASDVKSLYQNSAYIDSSGNVYGAVHTEV